ncbi:hypothetical protein ACRAWF_06140 [Streptomyces sp. L7]
MDEALAVGIRPGLSIDVEVALASDLVHPDAGPARHPADARGQRRLRHRRRALPITTRDVLDFATLQGARTNGLGLTSPAP